MKNRTAWCDTASRSECLRDDCFGGVCLLGSPHDEEDLPEVDEDFVFDSTGHKVDGMLGWTRVLVTGSRTWAGVKLGHDGKVSWPGRMTPEQRWQFLVEYEMLTGIIEEIRCGFNCVVLMHGAANGADALAQKWADDHMPLEFFAVESYPADWAKFGRRAGYVRNQEMVDKLRPGLDVVLAFSINDSPGTRMCVELAKKAGIQTFVTSFDA